MGLLKAFGLIRRECEVVSIGCHAGYWVFCHVDGYLIRVDLERESFEVFGGWG